MDSNISHLISSFRKNYFLKNSYNLKNYEQISKLVEHSNCITFNCMTFSYIFFSHLKENKKIKKKLWDRTRNIYISHFKLFLMRYPLLTGSSFVVDGFKLGGKSLNSCSSPRTPNLFFVANGSRCRTYTVLFLP